jgi:hypothetical protein
MTNTDVEKRQQSHADFCIGYAPKKIIMKITDGSKKWLNLKSFIYPLRAKSIPSSGAFPLLQCFWRASKSGAIFCGTKSRSSKFNVEATWRYRMWSD